MSFAAVALAIGIILTVLVDAFETILLPRTVTRPYRLTRIFYLIAGGAWNSLIKHTPGRKMRDTMMSSYAPLSLVVLFAFWAGGLIVGAALLNWGLHTPFNGTAATASFGTNLYFSGVTFLTLGFGDVAPVSGFGRALAVGEAGLGFGFLALVISYLPVMYTQFSKREVLISMLDSRAGSPPTGGELLRRYGTAENMHGLTELLADMERWSAELLEASLSYPILAFYRSQHEQQSWLGAVTTILDACALIELDFRGDYDWQKALRWQAHLTFAVTRHAIVDLSQVLFIPPKMPAKDRLPVYRWKHLCKTLEEAGIPLCDDEAGRTQLNAKRELYEPYLNALSERLFLYFPPWITDEREPDNWQTSAWDNKTHL